MAQKQKPHKNVFDNKIESESECGKIQKCSWLNRLKHGKRQDQQSSKSAAVL